VDGLETGGAGVVDSPILIESIASGCGAAGIGKIWVTEPVWSVALRRFPMPS
jgi:hypothetical protein